MKITVLQQDLLPALQSVSRSCGIRSTLPVLANILLQTEQDRLKLSATNLEVGVIKTVKVGVLKEGEITVPARTFLEIVTSLSGAEITLDATTDHLKISTPSFNANINGIAATEFPAIPLASDQSITVDAQTLRHCLPEITFAAAADEGRPILTGILTEIKNGQLELVATDGFRLSHFKSKIEGANHDNFKVLIPRKTFEEIVRLIAEATVPPTADKKAGAVDGGLVEIATSENQNQLIFKIGQTQLSSRLIEGQFPAWEKIIPSIFENKTIVDRQELLKAVKLASVFARSEANIIRVETLKNKLKLSSQAKELGSQETEVEADVTGTKISIAFNGKFLIDALSACSAEQVSIEFSGNLSPALIKPIGEDGLEYIIMPIRLS